MKTDKRYPITETQIEELLGRFNPHPGKQFYKKMESAPWHKSVNIESRYPPKSSLPYWRSLAIASIALIMVIGVYFVSPSLQAVAQQFFQYFLPQESDAVTVKVTVPATIEQPGTMISYPLSMLEAEEIADFSIKKLSMLPTDFSFMGARFDDSLNTVTLKFQNDGILIFFTLRQLGNIKEYSSIGASAPVEIVDINGLRGEYVAGGWKSPAVGTQDLRTSVPRTQVTLDAVWDPNLLQHTIRWRDENYDYEILISGGEDITKSDVIQLAESVQ